MSLLSCYGAASSSAGGRSSRAVQPYYHHNYHSSTASCHPEYYDSEQHRRRMRGKRKLKPREGAAADRGGKHANESSSCACQQALSSLNSEHGGGTERRDNDDRTHALLAATFGFDHHLGTDPDLELRVVQKILRREGLLAKLLGLVRLDSSSSSSPSPQRPRQAGQKESGRKATDDALHVLKECRLASSNLALSIMEWRRSQRGFEALPLSSRLRPFVFRRKNYMLKMCHDTDFVSKCPRLLDVMQATEETVVGNPLMLANGLSASGERLERSLKRMMPPKSSAAEQGESKAGCKEEQLRRAELALLMELHMNEGESNKILLSNSLDVFVGGRSDQETSCSDRRKESELEPADRSVRENGGKEISRWVGQAKAQLARLSSPHTDLAYENHGTSRFCHAKSIAKSPPLVPQEIICFKAKGLTEGAELQMLDAEMMHSSCPEVLSVLPLPFEGCKEEDTEGRFEAVHVG